MLPTRPVDAAPLVDQMAGEIDALVEVVRTLAHRLLPPVLDELGLVPAIVELAERHRISGGLDVVVDVDDVSVDGPARQAIYGIVAEAVRNAVRHAEATTCTIAVRGDQRRADRVDLRRRCGDAAASGSTASGCHRCASGPRGSVPR